MQAPVLLYRLKYPCCNPLSPPTDIKAPHVIPFLHPFFSFPLLLLRLVAIADGRLDPQCSHPVALAIPVAAAGRRPRHGGHCARYRRVGASWFLVVVGTIELAMAASGAAQSTVSVAACGTMASDAAVGSSNAGSSLNFIFFPFASASLQLAASFNFLMCFAISCTISKPSIA